MLTDKQQTNKEDLRQVGRRGPVQQKWSRFAWNPASGGKGSRKGKSPHLRGARSNRKVEIRCLEPASRQCRAHAFSPRFPHRHPASQREGKGPVVACGQGDCFPEDCNRMAERSCQFLSVWRNIAGKSLSRLISTISGSAVRRSTKFLV